MKILKRTFSILAVALAVSIVSIVLYERYFTARYSNTKINVPFDVFKQDWGEPDKILTYDGGGKTVFYYTILNEFVFNVNENDSVILKYKR